MKQLSKKEEKVEDTLDSTDLCKELEKCRVEMRGPYLDKNENRKWRQKQREARRVTELEDATIKKEMKITPVITAP